MCAAFSLTLVGLVPLSAPTPAHAGQWLFTVTGTPTPTTNPPQPPPAWSPPTSQPSVTLSYGIGTGNGGGPGQTFTTSDSLKLPLHIVVSWAPDHSLPSDPEPSVVRLSETGSATAGASGSFQVGNTTTPVKGTSSASISGVQTGTVQYTLTGGTYALDRPVNGSASVTVTVPAGGSGGASVGTGFNYTINAVPINAALRVDQDLQISPVAATTRFSATISNDPGFTVDSVKISVDGTATTATVNPNNPNNYYIDWTQSGGNPSEHTVTATAKIHDSIGAISLDSTLPSGNGRPADDIIADVRPLSAKFTSNIPLALDAVTPVPTPEITWTAGGTSPATSYPAAYIQGQSITLTLTLGNSAGKALTGQATTGYACKFQATPYTNDPATGQADPTLTLYDNTTGTPFTPTSCGSTITVAATTPLDKWVAIYGTSAALSLYVKFTIIPTPVWRQLGSYPISNSLYAVVATPAAPMTTPWTGVLNYACTWARRTTAATGATTALAQGLYNNGTYNGGSEQDTTQATTPETFYLQDFLNGPAALYGQCNDFSDFLVCASNAIGAVPLQSQHIPGPFTTTPITASHDPNSADATRTPWAYHQFTGSSTFFDGCLKFQGLTTPADLTLQAYITTLISSSYPFSAAWPLFTPTIKNSRSNP